MGEKGWGRGDRFKRCHHNTQYIRQTHLHALWHFIDTDYNNNKGIPIGTGCTGRGRDKRARRTSSIFTGWTQEAIFLNTKSFAHLYTEMIPQIWLPIRWWWICFVFSYENHRKKKEDQSLIFGNRMKTKKWWIIIRLHFLRGTDLRDSPKVM